MNSNDTSTDKSEFLLLFRGTDWHHGLSPDQIQSIMESWGKWFTELSESGKLVSGHPLENQGVIISGKSGQVADGPFTESKESVGGYFYLKVASLDEAVAIGHNCPVLAYGVEVEVRPVAAACPMQRMMDEMKEMALS
ncbi:hypothetical protein JIN85_08245 [Luteolibacter pohnpeiensis]|uniref:YCII-related domain-containing protein n=1 Tax=Luteolibacter pohnpeiensis TaxID=454153 RepID=A0A934S4J5_9BACT|nr:YciI family protein [Luteolibacter pohnpeiensis]MBK1882401.1 hypothetical protein [Luteolibacter pohnpeiensis]